MKDVPGVCEQDLRIVTPHPAPSSDMVELKNFDVSVPVDTDALIKLDLGLSNRNNKLVVALSPAAAKMIATDLNRAVKKYLKGASLKQKDENE